MAGGTEFNASKFKDLLLYASSALRDDPSFGSTKLNKVLYFSDVEAYRLRGRSITGAEYRKNRYGPTAKEYVPLVNALLSDGEVEIRRELIADHEQDVLVPLSEPRTNSLSKEEKRIVDRTIEDLRLRTNVEVSDLSHERSAGWRAKKQGETIPYETWLIDPEPADEEAVDFLRRLEGLPG